VSHPKHDYRVPVSDDNKRRLNEIGALIKERLPEGWGFGLLMFTYGEGGTMTWISSAQREDMLKAMQEFIQKQGS
jgi:hypothetical protein